MALQSSDDLKIREDPVQKNKMATFSFKKCRQFRGTPFTQIIYIIINA